MRTTHHTEPAPIALESLEPRRLLAASVAAVAGEDGVIVVTGTPRRDRISVVQHAPGVPEYDVLANGGLVAQFGSASTGIRIGGRGGNDVLSVSLNITLACTILGGAGSDHITGGGGPDSIDGGPGHDALAGRVGTDRLLGRHGDDTLYGGDHDDTIDGGPGRDHLVGGAGNDILAGGTGADTLDGGEGDDVIAGGRAHDLLSSGPGADTFDSADHDTEIFDPASEDSR